MPDAPAGPASPLPDPESLRGLDQAQAAALLLRHGPNALPGSAPRGLLRSVAELLREPMLLMLLAAGGIYLALGDRAEAAALLVFVFVVLGIALTQQRKTEHALQALRELSAPRACVIRDGAQRRIAARELVPSDLLVLREGDRIAADARVLHGQMRVDESLLSGESAMVDRGAPRPGAPAGDLVYAGTQVTQGTAVAEVVATGSASAFGRIGESLATTRSEDSRLQRAAARLVRRLAVLAWGFAALLALLEWQLRGRGALPSLLSGIALAMALLPEEIPVVLGVFLGLGAWRMAARQVLARRIPAVEALGGVTVLAADKTGTLTVNRMQLACLRTPHAEFDSATAGALPEEFHELLEFAMLATPPDPFDPMERAIRELAHQRLRGTEHLHERVQLQAEYPLSPRILAMTRVVRTDATTAPGACLLATKGAPEAIVDLCHLDQTPGRPGPDPERLREQVDALAARGLRVLAVARGVWNCPHADPRAADWPATQHDFDFEFLGLLGFFDPPREGVAQAVAACRDAGVRVIMLTGDHPATARAVAAQVGVSRHARLLLGDDIDSLDDAALAERLRDTEVCARLQPRHKLRLVRALQADAQVVAMTGDGVNDAPALKAADVGIAMGERGSDVAREAASLVLLDDSFASIVEAMRQGRRVWDNLAKAMRFIVAVHVPVVALALLPPLLGWPPLLMPLHIVLLQLVIDPACSVMFEAEPAASDLMHRPPRPPQSTPFDARRLLPALAQGSGLAAALLGGCAWLLGHGWNAPDTRAAVFVALVAGVLLLILASRDPRRAPWRNLRPANAWLGWLALGTVLLLGALLLPALRGITAFGAWRMPMALAALAMLLPFLAWLEALRRLLPATRFASSREQRTAG